MSASGAAASSPATPHPPPQPPPPRTCFNTFCKEPTKADGRRRGWRLRSGDFAELCERCLCAYEQGNFCETFHNEIAGWRNCEACGKKVHCGCIVSVHAYMLLDAGGVDCIACARKYFGTVSPSNQMWVPSPSSSSSAIHHYHPRMHSQPMRPPFPGQWRLNISSAQSDLQQRLAFEFDRPRCASASMHHPDKKFDELPERNNGASQIINHHNVMRERFGNGAGAPPGLDPAYPYSIYHRVPENPNPNSSPNLSSNPSMSNTHPSLNPGNHNMSHNPNGNLNPNPSEGMENVTVFNNKGITGFFGPEGSEMMRSGGRPRLDGRNRAQQLLPRYWPRITDQELQLINGDSNSVITPLFEKMLSASDAGRIGRLVLPKKCAEAYFPAIQTPEGLPLTVQDANGKNWTFQFRFWPNNNSRMYVLEGITPCIQAMNLQAGDTVTFSRIDPEGKLVMGFRKAAPVHGEPEIQHLKSGSGFLTCPPPDINSINNINNNNNNNNNNHNNNNNPHNNNNKTDIKDPTNNTTPTTQSETGTHNPSIFKEPPTVGPTPLFPSRRRASNNNNLSGGKITKRLRIENEDSMELKVTWEEAQSLLRPPPDIVPSVTVVDGHEFEEYEEPPVLGRRTYFVTNRAGETHQWAQCCECMKWRKIPTDALLTAKWACSENIWDSERSSCSSPAELTLEQLVELMPTRVGGTKRKLKLETPDPSATCPSSDGLDTLANLAILDQHHSSSDVPPGSSAASPTTRHPRHRVGCSCIVCIQPPSGKGGPKHKSSCVCNVCITVRRRFRTLMMRKDFKRSFLGDEGTMANGEETPSAAGGRMIGAGPLVIGGDFGPGPACCSGDDAKNNMLPTSSSSSPIKTQIDLNIQPEKEEDTSPKSLDVLAATSAIKLLQETPVQETPAASS